MKKLLALFLGIALTASAQKYTPTQLAAVAAPYGSFSDFELESSASALLSIIAYGLVLTPSQLITNAAIYGGFSDRQLQEAQVALLNNITGGSGLSASSYSLITISPTRPANGDTNWFGPWTPGTTTAGIQEAWNTAVNHGSAIGAVTATKFVFMPGTYFYTNQILITNNFAIGVNWEGSQLIGSSLVYAGTNVGISTILFNYIANAGYAIDMPEHVSLNRLSFSALTQATNVLVQITNAAYMSVEHCNFTGWEVVTNSVGGIVTMNPSANIHPPVGLVGLSLGGPPGEHGVQIQDLFFADLADGLIDYCDHTDARNLRFAGICKGNATPNSFVGTNNLWASNSVFSIGACIIRNGGLESQWDYLHMWASHIGFAKMNHNQDACIIKHANLESSDVLVTTDGTGPGPLVIDPVAPGEDVVDYNPSQLFTPGGATYNGGLVYSNKVAINPFSYTAGFDPYFSDVGISLFVTLSGTNTLYLQGGQLVVPGGFVGSSAGLSNSVGQVVSPAGDYAVVGTVDYVLMAANHSATLPTSVGLNGRVITILNTGSGTNRILTTSSQTVNGSANGYTNTAQYKYVRVLSDNANWWVVGAN